MGSSQLSSSSSRRLRLMCGFSGHIISYSCHWMLVALWHALSYLCSSFINERMAMSRSILTWCQNVSCFWNQIIFYRYLCVLHLWLSFHISKSKIYSILSIYFICLSRPHRTGRSRNIFAVPSTILLLTRQHAEITDYIYFLSTGACFTSYL